MQTRDALGNTVSITYDLRGRKTALHDPDLGIRHYAWNAAGDLVRRTDAKGQVTEFQHDGLGRLVRRVEPDLDSRWHYGRHADGSACPHGAGRLCEVVADNGYRRRHVHDAAGRPVRTEFTLDGAPYTAAVGYDLASGRVATQTYPSGLQVGRRYTALGWLQELTDSRSGQPLWRVHHRDVAGRALRTEHGNGVLTEHAWFADGSLSATLATGPAGAVQNLAYTYDLNRNPLTRLDGLSGVSARYTHDGLDRLAGETRWGGALAATEELQWRYDAIGNLASRTEAGQTHTYLYNTSGAGSLRPHAVAGVSGSVNGRWSPSYRYDANGNLTEGAGRSQGWTSYDALAHVQAGDLRLEFVHDAEHQRVRQRRWRGGTLQASTVYLNPAGGAGLYYEEEHTPDGRLQARHYLDADGTTVAAIVCPAKPCTQAGLGSVQYWHADPLGSVAAVSGAGGAVLERLAYEPFGKRRRSDGATDPQGTLAGASTARGFTGHEMLDGVGLIHMNGRVYDPALGRFLSADPGVPHPQDPQSYNRYSYVRNHPLNAVDPGGLDDWWRTPSRGSYDASGHWDWGFPGGGGGLGGMGLGGGTAWGVSSGQIYRQADQLPVRSAQDCNEGGGCFLSTVTITGSGKPDGGLSLAGALLTLGPGGPGPWALTTPWRLPSLTLPGASTGLLALQRLSLPLALLMVPGNIGQDNGSGPKPGELGFMESRAGAAGGSDEGALDADGANSASLPPNGGDEEPNKGGLNAVKEKKLEKDGVDAHAMKKDFVGSRGGQYNISVDSSTGEVYLTPVRRGAAEPVNTGLKYSDLAEIYPLKKP